MSSPLAKENLLGYMVSASGLDHCVTEILECIESGKESRWLACINPHAYVVAEKDVDFATALKAADWLVPDGIGIVLASRWLRGTIRERVTGSDIFFRVQHALNERGRHTVFFLGSTPENLAEIQARVASEFPKVHIAGTYSPPFKPSYSIEENKAMVAAINAAAPDVLWVGMTAPKQEKWIFQNRDQIKVKFCAAVGAVFDFYTGRVKRSHPFFQNMGLEWLPRLLQEPRRLWRRMFVSAPIFVWHLIRRRHG